MDPLIRDGLLTDLEPTEHGDPSALLLEVRIGSEKTVKNYIKLSVFQVDICVEWSDRDIQAGESVHILKRIIPQ